MTKEKIPAVHRGRCGTNAGYRAHTRRGEEVCDECREAQNAYMREYRAKRSGKPVGKPRESRAAKKERQETEAAVVVDHKPAAAMTTDDPPAFLKESGRQLWNDVLSSYDLDLPAKSVLAEACRMRDRLERFTAALAANSTLWFELGDLQELEDGSEQVNVVVNGMISEARQLQSALAINLGKIGVLKPATAKASGPSVQDEMAAKRKARQAAAAKAQEA